MIGETLLKSSASFVLKQIKEYAHKKLFKNKTSEYQKELYEIIQQTIKKYAEQFPIAENAKIPFYHSQTLLEIFLAFKYSRKIDYSRVKQVLDMDSRIISPSPQELEAFLDLFNKEINSSPGLKILNNEVNYKEEIFNISDTLTSFRNELGESIDQLKTQIKSGSISQDLIDEWNSQLDEISEEIKTYKIFSARKRLDKIENRITEAGFLDDKFFARLLWLKSTCMDLIGDFDIQEEHAELLIKMYKLQPKNEDYKSNAAQSYFVLGNVSEARKLASELLLSNEFNVIAWIVRIFIADKNFQEVLYTIPPNVRNKNIFKLHFYRWVIHKKLVRNAEDIASLNLHFDIDYTKEADISYKNIRYQLSLVGYLLSNFFQRNLEINERIFYAFAKEDAEFIYLHKLLKKITDSLAGSEVENGYQYYFFYYHFSEFVLTQNKDSILFMGRAFEAMKFKPPETVIHMVQGYTTFGTREYDLQALEIVKKHGDQNDEVVLLLVANLYALIGEKDKQIETFIKYINSKRILDRIFYINFLSFAQTHLGEVSEHLANLIEHSIFEKEFSAAEYKNLLRVFCFTELKIGSFSNEELVLFIEQAKEKVNPADEDIVYEVARSYCLINKTEKAKEYLKPIIKTRKYSKLLKFYCKVLFDTEGDKPELLEILKYWRQNFKPDYVLLQMEFDLRRLQHLWKEATDISLKALESFPESEFFLQALFISMKNDFNKEGIKKYAYLVERKNFKREDTAANISTALYAGECYREALELLYDHAVTKTNQYSRQKYIQLFLVYPVQMTHSYETAEVGTFVKYEIGQKSEVLELTELNIKHDPGALFVKKKVGDVFSFRVPLTGLITQITVIKISDKYTTLLDELMVEAENPLSGHAIQSFKFEDDTFAGMERTFIKYFGASGSLEQDFVAKQFDLYYKGKISFTEITGSVFKKHFINAYLTLTNQANKPFKAIAPSVNKGVQLSENTKFVLDFTSICLFYEISHHSEIQFPAKFHISHLIREQIAENLEEATREPPPKMSLTITYDKIKPHFYDDGFKERRINLFKSILIWVDTNCIMEDVPERLNLIANQKEDVRDLELFASILVESNILANRPDHVMLTNDVFHYRQFKGGTHIFISPLLYLRKYFPDNYISLLSFMLNKNYVGLTVTFELLQQEFNKKNLNLDNRFQICLENLNYSWNPDESHITETIKFIKYLYIERILSKNIRDITVTTVLKNLIRGMDLVTVKKMLRQLMSEFNLMGIYSNNIQELFYSALKELHTENRF